MLLSTSTFAEDSQKGVAVYPFAAKGGAEASLAEGLGSLFSTELASASCVRLVAEDLIRDLARQQGLEQACGTESCQVDLAKQAKADVLVRGDLARVDDQYFLTTVAVDLKSKKTLFTEKARGARAELAGLAENLGRQVGARACGNAVPSPATPPPVASTPPTAGLLAVVRTLAPIHTPTGEMIEIPAGDFLYGPDKEPAYLPAFIIDKTEVTVAAYATCIQAGACSQPNIKNELINQDCNKSGSGRDDHPMNCITWRQADTFCKWAGKRLPTEQEWEKAARGTDGRTYPWGEEPATCERTVMAERGDMNRAGCGEKHTWPVCSKPAGNSPYGLCDMAGNVMECTASIHKFAPADHRVTRSDWWGSLSDSHALRKHDPFPMRITYSLLAPPDWAMGSMGFRCAKSVDGSTAGSEKF